MGTHDDKADDGSAYVTVTEAARIMGCCRRTVLRAIKAQTIKAERLGPRGWFKVLRASLPGGGA